MLVLGRREGEEIVIGSDITITVVSIVGSRIRLGIKAPPNVPIYRKELLDRRAPDVAADLTEMLGKEDSPL